MIKIDYSVDRCIFDGVTTAIEVYIWRIVPVYLSKRKELVKVEIQIRTIAMDFLASLEHDLAYKLSGQISGEMVQELKDCADVIAQTDLRMQKMYNRIFTLNNKLVNPVDTK